MATESFPSSPELSGPSREPMHDLISFFPTPEDWIDIQGGIPRVFRHPDRPNTRWLVVHVYDEHSTHAERFQSGLIVDTRPPEGDHFQLLRKTFTHYDEKGQPSQRDVYIPSFMDRSVHGDVCEGQSAAAGSGEGYDRIRTQEQYQGFVDRMERQGYQEMRFARKRDFLDKDRVVGFRMEPNVRIRAVRSLDT